MAAAVKGRIFLPRTTYAVRAPGNGRFPAVLRI